jgi:hypothetical protein
VNREAGWPGLPHREAAKPPGQIFQSAQNVSRSAT